MKSFGVFPRNLHENILLQIGILRLREPSVYQDSQCTILLPCASLFWRLHLVPRAQENIPYLKVFGPHLPIPQLKQIALKVDALQKIIQNFILV